MSKKNDVFIEITNSDIYNKIIQENSDLKGMINDLQKDNDKAHIEIIKHQLNTNGKVRLNRWMSGVAIMVSLMAIGYIFAILS